MAKSSTPRRSLKSLFSKKEVSHDESVEKSLDKNEGQKKRFQFLKFKSKPKTDPGPVKAVHGSQQLLSAAEPSNSAEDGGTWVDNIASDKKLSLYGTSPRSKASILPSSSQAKALSYSELDLRKPKRIASFSFGFRRKKKNDNEENISKSTTVLDSPGLEEPKEPPLRLSQVKLDETDTKTTFSVSQPVLDTSDKFDIPSPPPVATNQSESYFTISKQSESNVDINIRPEAKEPLTSGSNLSAVREELQKAPIATIPELQLDNLESLEENENIPVYDNSNPSEPTTLTEMTFAVNDQSEPILSDTQPLIVPDTSNDKVAVAESVSLSNGPCDNDILQQSHKTTEISLAETNRDALSYHQPDAPDTADSTAQNVELSLASVDSKIDATIMESTPVPHADNSTLSADSASVHQEVSISRTEGSTPETATTVTATSTVRKEKSTQPVSQTAIYGELYDSLLPQSLILEVVSSISNPPSQIRTETRPLSTRSEPILVKTLNEHHTDTNVIYSHLSTSRELYSSPGKMSNATGGYTNNNATFSESKVIPATSRFMSNETSTAFQPQRNTDIYSRYLTSPLNSAYKPADSGNIPHSTLTHSLSEVKSDSVSLIQDNVSSVSVVQSPAPPASDDVMSQEGDAQVTDSKRRAILIKELVTEEVSSDTVCPSPAPEKMSATEGLEIKIEKRESFSAHSGLMSGSDRALSPAYLSMGSDDGSATEIYYSAEEDNAEEYTVDERKESHVVDVVKEAGLREQIPQKEEIAESRIKNREEGEFKVVIVKTQSEEDIIGKEQEKVDLNSRFEVQQQVRGQRSEDKVPQIVTSRFLVGSDAKSQEKEEAATVSPQMKEDRKEETKEKLPATLDNAEKSKDVEVYKVDERKESSVADVVKEAGLREEIPQKEEIAESRIKKTEEGEFKVVIAKTQSEEGKIGNEEEKLDLNSRTEVQQQVRSQKSEDKVPRIIASRFLVGNDAKSQEKEEAATVSPQVKEDKKEETKEKLPTTLDNTEKSKDVEVYKVDERKESSVADVVKEAALREEIPQKEEIADSRIKKTEEGEFKVVIAKTQSEEGKIGNEVKLDLNSQTEVQQQVRGQRSEDKVPRIITSRFLVGSDTKRQEKEEAATVLPQVKEDKKEERKQKLPATLDNTEKGKDVEGYKVDERKESRVADVVKETRLREQIPQKEDIAESRIKKTEEGEFKVVIAKTQSEEGKIGNEEEKLDLNSRTEVQQQVRSQKSEDKVPRIITSRFLVGNDAKSQEKEEAATVSPQVKEDKKEETKEKLPTTLDNTEKSKDVEVYKVDERKESSVADVVKEAGLREEIPQKEEIAESRIKKTEEGEFKVVIAKTQSEEGKIGNEVKLDLNSRTEVQQQVRGQRSEDKVPRIITSRFLVGSDTKRQEKEEAATVLPQVKEDKKEETKEKLPATLDNTEKSKDVEVYKVVADVVKEAGLREEIPQKEEIAESGIKKTEEGEFKVVIAKTQSEEGKLGKKEEKLDLNSRTEVQQQVRGQRSEDKVPRIITSRFLVGNDAWSQEKEVAATVLPQVKGEREEEKKEELPATPVQQVNTLMVCDFAPPSSKPHGQGEGSEGNWTAELETEDPPNGEKQLPSQKTQYLSHKDTVISEYMHAVSSHTRKEDTITPRLREAEEQVSLTAQADKIGEESKDSTGTSSVTTASAFTDTSAGVKVVAGTLTHSTELQSDAPETEHNRAPQSSEWVDTITRSTDRTRTVQEQVAVELSTPNVDTQCPDTKAAESLSERHQHPAEAQPDLNQGSLTASRTSTAASGVLASESQPTEADKKLVDEMNSGYSSLSTKLSLKTSSPPKEDESKNRFRKVSLVNETDTTEVSEDAMDVSKTSTTVTESNGTDTNSDFKWKNRFEGVSQYRPYKTEFSSFTDSPSYRVSDTDTSPSLSSSSSALPEATAYKHLSNAYSSPFSSPAPDEHTTLGNRLSDRTTVYLRYESEPAEAPKDEWRRSLVEQEEPAAPAAEREGQRERGGESERIKSHWDSHELPVSSLSSAQQTSNDVVDSFKKEDDDDSSRFTGVFTATLVELVSEPAAPPSTPPGTPEEDSPSQFDMDSLVDTLKSMGPSLRPRNIGPRAPAPVLISSLPPIVEDAPSPITADIPGLLSPTKKMEAINNPAESLKGLYTLPADLGLKRSSNRDTRSPLELMKQSQQDLPQPGTRGLNLPQRASATNSIVMRKSSDSSPEELKSPALNGNGLLPSSTTGSRLDSSVIFGSHRSASIDQPLENGKAHRSLFRTSSLPETGPLKDRMSVGPKELGDQSTEPAGSRFDRFSFLLNSSPSASSLTGSEDSTRISRPPLLGMGSPPPSNSPTRLLSPTGSIDLQRPFTTTDSPLSVFGQTQGLGMGMGVGAGVLSPPILQRSFSNEGTAGVQQTPLFNSLHGVSPFQSQEVETERTLAVKYRAFPDAYLTKEKEHGKLNPRPGKMYIFDRPGMCGQRIEIRSDVIDATSWELQETISIRVVRGGWVMYEKPNFKGEKIALDEGDIELTYPFSPPEEQLQNGQEGEKQNGEATDAQAETKPARRFIIGSLRRAVRDYSVPEISLFPEENAEGKKVIFRDTSEDARIFGFPVKANSIIINAGLWLVYAHPFFQGVPRVLEVGGYSNPAAWGVEQPYVGSLHPLKVGEPRVENTSEPKMVIYDKPYFSGKSRTITTNTRDFITRVDRQQTAFMYSVGSLKVLGGIWVGYEKEGFRGHQYLLEEGEYQDWRVWGGNDAELRSTRVIRADLTDPMMVMFEQPEEDQEGMSEENTFEVTEAIPDVELFGYKTSTRSIHVLSGAWIAYSHVDFSGNQYILEKGFYNNCADWGSQDTRICSVQPILLAPGDNARSRTEIILYSEPDFQGECHVFDRNQEATPEKLLTKSCRVSGGSWVVYENKQYSGNLYVLSEGDYPSLTSMGCLSDTVIRSVKVVPMKFSVPSISLFGLECLEGREITTDTEIPSMVEEGFNNHILSVRVNSGCWVICEHSNYRGRQFLLEQIEITNWPKFSSLQTIGSMFPVRQKRRYFRIKSKERGHFMSVQGGVEEMKSGRVVVAPEVEPMSDIWFYQDGFIKSKLAQNMSLQVMGNIEPGAKVVLWTETRQPIQTWAAQMSGLITSLTFPGCVLDVKGGKTYDKDHVVMMPENEERPSQQWEIELL
ncbi:uncharacterized protein crybg2 isoform X1 [Epinephelus fuscoguttatus]|uniref:uncharacterized protein crybg2 isoform X1 n=1 Tax=Epinephelus fuscoguttatus TaxID=293821 RepID=UPI0020D0E67B|nr:uncharacterized protein crybg2 isoform X1 [Epinephelus fuscoguttatus]